MPEKPDSNSANVRLRNAISESGLTAHALSQITGQSQPQVSRFLSGDSGVTLHNISEVWAAIERANRERQRARVSRMYRELGLVDVRPPLTPPSSARPRKHGPD